MTNKTLRSSNAVMTLFEDLEHAGLRLGNAEHHAVLAIDRYLQNLFNEMAAREVDEAMRADLRQNFRTPRRQR